MTTLKLLNREYSQKSTLFLYSVLGIPRQMNDPERIFPIVTFMSWEGKYTALDRVLLCVYPIQQSKNFQKFEKEVLLVNPRYHAMHLLNDDFVAYGFLFQEPADYDHFGKVYSGRYSQIKPKYKEQILKYYRKPISHYDKMNSYLHPMKYVKDYADELTVPSGNISADVQNKERVEKIMVQVGELCSRPDYDREELDINLTGLDFFKKRLTLPKYQINK